MKMCPSMRPWQTRFELSFLLLLGILFLEPCLLPRCEAQQDDKDKVIEQQRKAIESQKRLIDDSAKRIRDLQEKLLASLAESNRARLQALNAEERAKSLQARNDSLLEVVRELTRKLVLAEVKGNPNPPKRDPENPNPPVNLVNGKIAKITGELIQLDIGTDHGLAKNQTLDVYRLQPEAKYLGMIRIVEVTTKSAIARYAAPAGKTIGSMLKVGDRVTSKLSADSK